MNVHWCPCGGQVEAGGDAPAGGGQCLGCRKVYENAVALREAGGSSAIICTGRGRRKPKVEVCQVAGCRRASVALCDEPVGARRTCDPRICDEHRTAVGRNRDRCPEHAPAQRELIP